jgi:hypothetical protein
MLLLPTLLLLLPLYQYLQSLSVRDCRFYGAPGDAAGMHAALAQLPKSLQRLTSVRLQYSEVDPVDRNLAAEALAALPMSHLRVECQENDVHIGVAAAECLCKLTVRGSLLVRCSVISVKCSHHCWYV